MTAARTSVYRIAIALSLCMPAALAQARSVKLTSASGGPARALIVGINQYASPAIPNLKGALADAQDIEKTLRAAGLSDVTALTESTATRRAFEQAISRLISVSSPGDLAIISFAGHGAQEPELVKGSESDGMDEIFLLYGFNSSGPGTAERIIDDELNHWLRQLSDKKVDVLFIADTCHGGGLTRMPDFRSGELTYRAAKVTIPSVGDELKPISTPADATLTSNDIPTVTFLAAVDKFSKAPEVRIPDYGVRGALSYAVARSIDGGADGAVTRQQLFGYAGQLVYQNSQTQQIIATEPANELGRVVFRLKVSDAQLAPSEPLVAVRVRAIDPRVAIPAGSKFPTRLVGPDEDADVVYDPARHEALNGFGDVVSEVADIGDLTGAIDAVGATLAISKLSEGGVQGVRVLPDGRRYRAGEIADLHIDNVKDKFLILVNVAGNGEVQFLYPRDDKKDKPQIDEQDFDLPLRSQAPFGADHLVVVLSDKPLATLQAALRAADGQRDPRKLVDALRAARSEEASTRIGIAAVFTTQ